MKAAKPHGIKMVSQRQGIGSTMVFEETLLNEH